MKVMVKTSEMRMKVKATLIKINWCYSEIESIEIKLDSNKTKIIVQLNDIVKFLVTMNDYKKIVKTWDNEKRINFDELGLEVDWELYILLHLITYNETRNLTLTDVEHDEIQNNKYDEICRIIDNILKK